MPTLALYVLLTVRRDAGFGAEGRVGSGSRVSQPRLEGKDSRYRLQTVTGTMYIPGTAVLTPSRLLS